MRQNDPGQRAYVVHKESRERCRSSGGVIAKGLFVCGEPQPRWRAAGGLFGEVETRFANCERTPVGSSLKLCVPAEGGADIYPRLGPTSEWDIGAAQAVLTAAGGRCLRQTVLCCHTTRRTVC